MNLANLIWVPIIGGGLFFTNSAIAQDLTLNQAIEKAIEHNGNMKTVNLEIEKSQILSNSSVGLDKTDIGVQYGQLNGFEKDLSFNIEQNFKFPTAYKHQKQLNTAKVSTMSTQQLITQNDLVREIKTTWYQLIYLNQAYQLGEYKDSLFSQYDADTREKFQAGNGTYLETITAETKLMTVKNELSDVRLQISTQLLMLQILMNQDTPIESITDSIIKNKLETTFDDSSALQNPKLKYLQDLIVIREKEMAVNKANYLPEFKLGYFNQSMIGSHTVNGVEQYYGSGQRFQGVSATISVPIFTKATKSKVNASKIDQQIAQTNAEYYEKQIQNEYKIAVDRYIKYKVQLSYYEDKALAQADLIIENSKKSYQSGNISSLEYVQSLNTAIELKHNYNEILKKYNQSIVEIEYIVGK